MKKPNNNFINLRILAIGLMFCLTAFSIHGQELPPRPISIFVSPIQQLSFGAILTGSSGGSVIVYPDGTRSSTGDVILGNYGYSHSPALFEIEANPGTLISIINGPNIILSGSNGGTMTLEVGSALPVSPFVTTSSYPTRTLLRIGGTLNVGNALSNPEGSYSGSFYITLFQE